MEYSKAKPPTKRKEDGTLTEAEWTKIHNANKRSERNPDPAQQSWIETNQPASE